MVVVVAVLGMVKPRATLSGHPTQPRRWCSGMGQRSLNVFVPTDGLDKSMGGGALGGAFFIDR